MRYEQAEFLADFVEQQEALQARARSTVEKAQAELMRPVDRAYGAIEAAADALVEKSDHSLSQAQAVDRVLRTPRGARLYGKYLAAREQVAKAAEIVEQDRAEREMRRHATEKLLERVEKSTALGEDLEAAVARELSDPEVARSIGVAPVVPIAKGDGAWASIEKAAERLVAKSAEPVTKEQAISRVLREQPRLYDRYLEEVESA